MNTRALTATIIYKVCYEGISLSDAFDSEFIPDSDRSFVKEMAFGTIRYWIRLQAILKDLLEKPLKSEDNIINCLLCIGLYQCFYMNVPEYAVVDETVTATRILKKPFLSRLVNKILRMAIDQKNNDTLTVRGITAEYAHPNWIIEKIQTAYPQQWQAILMANNQKAPLFLRVNQSKITRDDFEKKLQKNKIEYETVNDLPHAIVLKNALPVEKIPGFNEGLFCVQDASGQAVIDYLDLHEGQIVLDACAAPGSKTTHILETMPSIKKLVAIDISPNRLKRISENIVRLRLPKATLIAADVCDVETWWDHVLFDRILVDAPCSASGVIRRHPDIKLLRKKTDIKNLAKTQLQMLTTLWPLLKDKGKLIYTTCSVFRDENEEVVDAFLSTHKMAKKTISHQNVPTDQGGDGFYYVVIERCVGPSEPRAQK